MSFGIWTQFQQESPSSHLLFSLSLSLLPWIYNFFLFSFGLWSSWLERSRQLSFDKFFISLSFFLSSFIFSSFIVSLLFFSLLQLFNIFSTISSSTLFFLFSTKFFLFLLLSWFYLHNLLDFDYESTIKILIFWYSFAKLQRSINFILILILNFKFILSF